MGIIKRVSTGIVICSVLITPMTVYAQSTAMIDISASIECPFKGEIYVILADKDGNQKLALLTSSNNYKYKLDVPYGTYVIKDIHVFNKNETDKKRQEISAKFTITSDNLNLSENNKKVGVKIDIHSITTKGETKVAKIKEGATENKESKDNKDIKIANKLSKRKKFTLFNLILDGVIIISLGAVWFFKIRKRKEK